MYLVTYIAVVSFESIGGSDFTIQVSESNGSLQVVLVLNKPVDQQVTVFVIASNLTATGLLNLYINSSDHLIDHLAVDDFGPSKNYTVTFTDGSTRQSVNIPIIADDVCESDETFQLEISVPKEAVAAGITLGCDSSVTVKITDDDNRKLYIS